jgi:hypothetical protein
MKFDIVSLQKTPSEYYRLILEVNDNLEYYLYTKQQLAKIVLPSKDPATDRDPKVKKLKEYIVKKFESGDIC